MDDASTLLARGHFAGERQAVRILADAYSLTGTVKRVAGERDDNFIVDAGEHGKFFLKVAHSEEDPVVTNFQTAALEHVARTSDVPVPSIIPTTSGDAEARVDVDGVTRTVRLTSFLPGAPVDELAPSPGLRRSIGHTLGRLNHALRTFDHPAADNVQLWDVARAAQLRPMVEGISDPSIASRLGVLLERAESRLLPELPYLRHQIVHNDFSADNLRGSADQITGVLDFGDATRTALIVDVAVAAAYQLRDDDGDDVLAPAADVLSAYHEADPLRPDEVVLFFEALLARMLVRLTITEWRAERFPDNRDYIIRNNARSWRVLGRLLDLDEQAATNQFRKAVR